MPNAKSEKKYFAGWVASNGRSEAVSGSRLVGAVTCCAFYFQISHHFFSVLLSVDLDFVNEEWKKYNIVDGSQSGFTITPRSTNLLKSSSSFFLSRYFLYLSGREDTNSPSRHKSKPSWRCSGRNAKSKSTDVLSSKSTAKPIP